MSSAAVSNPERAQTPRVPSHPLETGATPILERRVSHSMQDVASGSHSARSGENANRNDDEFVALNDLVVARSFAGLLAANGLDSLDALFRAGSGESLRKAGLGGWRERIRLTLRRDKEEELRDCACGSLEEPRACACGSLEGPRPWACGSFDVTVYLKRYTHPPRSASRGAIRAAPDCRSLAGVEWYWLRRLAADGIPAPRPVALGEELAAGREIRSVLVMTAVGGDALERVLAEPDALDPRRIRGLAPPLAELVGRFHRLGYVHRDLYLSHVFFDATQKDEAGLSLIDLQRVMRPATRCSYRIVKDLASLNFSTPSGRVTTTERLRWLRRYLESNALPFSSRLAGERESPLVDKPPVAPGVGWIRESMGHAIGTRKLDAAGRRLVYRIVGKTLQIQRHQERRATRFAAGSGSR